MSLHAAGIVTKARLATRLRLPCSTIRKIRLACFQQRCRFVPLCLGSFRPILSDMPEVVIILVVVAILVTLILLWGVTREKQRDASVALIGEQLGLEYERDGRALAGEPFTRFSLFQEGRRRRFKNHLRGHVGGASESSGPMGRDADRSGISTPRIEVILFDYRYVTGSHRQHHTHQTTIAAFHAVGEDLPELSLQPENLLHKIGGLLGYQDIDFDENPSFSRRYLLRGPKEDHIRKIFTPEVLDFFDEHPGWCVEAGGDWIVIFRRGRRILASDLKSFLNEAFEICTMLAIHF